MLSLFEGADASGTWQLSVIDDADNDVGTLHYWSLRITY